MTHVEESILVATAAVFRGRPEIQCCYVYGSAARGQRKRGSDVDLAVAAHHVLSVSEKSTLKDELERALLCDVDLIDLLSATGTILRQAMRGVCLLCRSTDVKYRLMRKLIYDQEDLQPARRSMMDTRRKAFVHGH
jgi:predicted nucleotidyltransferase